MAKGTAGKSSTGASMSKYDVEVEARLQQLEKSVETLAQQMQEVADSDYVELNKRFNEAIAQLKKQFPGSPRWTEI